MTRRKTNSRRVSRKFPFLVIVVVALAVCYFVFGRKLLNPDWTDIVGSSTRVTQVPSEQPSGDVVEMFKPIGGLPAVKRPWGTVLFLNNIGYATGYDTTLMDPVWSAYYCGPKKNYEAADRNGISFKVDKRIPSLESRLKTADFNRHQGDTITYDRGHMAPNYAIASRYGTDAQEQTFLLTNITPQRSSLNQQTWRYLEEEITGRIAPQMDGVWVIVGPIFSRNTALQRYNGKAAIPVAFYCIVVDRDDSFGNRPRALAVVMSQSVSGNHSLREFITTIRNIENETGLDFFAALPDDVENALETSVADAAWGLDAMLSN